MYSLNKQHQSTKKERERERDKETENSINGRRPNHRSVHSVKEVLLLAEQSHLVGAALLAFFC